MQILNTTLCRRTGRLFTDFVFDNVWSIVATKVVYADP